MADLRANTALFVTIDDHEVANDFAGGAAVSSDSRFDQTGRLINETQLYRDGLKAFVEFNPLKETTYQTPGVPRTDGKPKLYRSARYGQAACLFLLDARSFRDSELATPEDPNNALQVGAFLFQSFDLNPSAPVQPLPRRTMLGQAQLSDLKSDLIAAERAGVTWKFVDVPEPIQNLGVLAASDRFEGYAAERSELLGFIHTNHIRNVVFISADIHGTLINNLTFQAGSPASPQIPLRSCRDHHRGHRVYAPFGPTVLDLAAAVPSGSGPC
jgi:phosphodiesterase/alkaline phosphatase D-like protein